jgi:hypothetical protein
MGDDPLDPLISIKNLIGEKQFTSLVNETLENLPNLDDYIQSVLD